MTLNQLNDFLILIDSYIGSSPWFVYLLLGTGLFFTIYLKFPQVRYLRHSLNIVRGKYDDKNAVGDTSHFQSLATALSGTVGTGNIAGVAFAIHLGGPSALFWMLVTAFLGMTTKFVEVTLSHKYRETAKDGSISGGPMYYMKNAMNMKWLAVIFSIATIISSFGTGNMPQINSIASSMFSTFGLNPWITGAVLSVLLAIVILGGIKRIAATTEKLVPAMAIIYFIGALLVIGYHYDRVIPSFLSIFSDVFSGTAATGGFLGATIAFAFNRGVNRGLFSNEAGQGSAPIAHAAAKAKHPVSEGMVALLEPMIDTIIICTLTGLVLLTSGVWNEKMESQFAQTDVTILSGVYEESNQEHLKTVSAYLNNTGDVELFSGLLEIENGAVKNEVTIIHARSFAEDLRVYDRGELFTGNLSVDKGVLANLPPDLSLKGKSLIHSAPLTAEAFSRGFMGTNGKYIVSIGLLLFAFSTAISWSYYGGRAVTFLFGSGAVIYYRVFYVIAFFAAAIIDTTIVWTFSGIAIALMTIPNLFGILSMRKEMKSTMREYLDEVKPNE